MSVESNKDRRGFLKLASAGTLTTLAASAGLAGCTSSDEQPNLAQVVERDPTETAVQTVGLTDDLPMIEWDMPTSWVPSLDVLWSGTLFFCQQVSDLTSGRFVITPRPAGEVAGPLEILPVVSDRSFPIGSTAAYYYSGSSPVLSFSTAVPFGLTNRQHMSWLLAGGGLEILQDYYAKTFNVIQFPVISTGAQMGGWFTKEINSAADLKGLKMRIPGLGAQVMSRLGVEPQSLGSNEILAALQTGEIEAAEFIGPSDDYNIDLHTAAPYYYFPGFWEPNATSDVQINLDDWNSLPTQYQVALSAAASNASTYSMAQYDARNGQALNDLVAGGTQLRPFPDDVMQAGRAASGIILDEIAETDADFKVILEQWRRFRSQVSPWFSLAEAALLQ